MSCKHLSVIFTLCKHSLLRTDTFAFVAVPDATVRTNTFVQLRVKEPLPLATEPVLVFMSIRYVVVVSTMKRSRRDVTESEETGSEKGGNVLQHYGQMQLLV
jgi:hypothetical protein